MRKKKIINFAGALLALTLAVSCDNMNDVHQKYIDAGERVYLGKTDSLTAFSEIGQVKLVWYVNADPNIENTVIYWNTRRDSVIHPFVRTWDGIQKDSAIIELEEGEYLFELVNTNRKGERSLPATIQGSAYARLRDITVNTSPLELSIWEGAGLRQAKKVPENARETLVWSSANPGIATVDETGIITPVKMGTTTVTVQNVSGTIKKDIPVTVFSEPSSFDPIFHLALTPTPLPLAVRQAGNPSGTGSIPGEGNISLVEGPAPGKIAIQIPLKSHFQVKHLIPANGGGERVNEYTLLVDFKVPQSGVYFSFVQTNYANTDDVDVWINPTLDAINTGGTYANLPSALQVDTWYRWVLSVKLGESVRSYINGQKFHTFSSPVDLVRLSLDPTGVILFGDENGDDYDMTVSGVAMWDRALTDEEIAAIGGL